MNTIIKGKNFHVSDDLKEKVHEKLEKITRHQHVNIKEIEIEFSVEKNPSISDDQTVEITAFTKGPVIRAKKASSDMLASIELVVDKLDRQIEKYKGKLYKSQNHKSHHEAALLKENYAPKIERTKTYSTEPITVDEAILYMELLQHDFFVFRNAETTETNILYFRKNGSIGLLKPQE